MNKLATVAKKIIKFPLTVKKLLKKSSLELELSGYFQKKSKVLRQTSDVIVVQTVEDPYYLALFGLIATSWSGNRVIRIEQLVLHSIRVSEADSFSRFVGSRLVNRVLCRKWERLYSSFCDGVAYRNAGLSSPISDFFDLFRAFIVWRGVKTKADLVALVIEGVRVGDLVNDTYLRYKPAPTVDLKNIFLLIVIWQAFRDLRRASGYFKQNKSIVYLTSYSTYIHHGIAARVALKYEISVFSFGNAHEFAKKLSLQDTLHSRNSDSYASKAAELTDLETKIALSDKILGGRISGVVDKATAYMKNPAYGNSTIETVPDVNGAVIIFLHDFYDSPHVYRDMIFTDFWEWICFTVETLSESGIKFYLKPHPNQIELSDSVLIALKDRYPAVSIISSKVSNKRLVDAGMGCAVTVYGTVAHEMAYMGVPTIASANHPHISFDFCKTAKSKDEYGELLRNALHLDFDQAAMRRQSLIFYYMHNLNVNEDEKSINEAFLELRKLCANTEKAPKDALVSLIKKIETLPAFIRHVNKLI
jgi:hypothetical protein